MFLIPTQASFFFMRAPSPPTLSRFISALPLLSGGFSDVVVRSYLRSLITPSLSLSFFPIFTHLCLPPLVSVWLSSICFTSTEIMQLSSVQVVEFIQFNMVLLKSFNKYTFRLDEQITFLHFLCFPLFLHHSVAVVTGHSLGLGWVGGVPPTTHVIAGSSKTPSSSFYITR